MKRTILIAMMFVTAACEEESAQEEHAEAVAEETEEATEEAADEAEDQADEARAATEYAADNTGRNERDQDMDTLTPEDQGGSEEDRTITQRVRQGVVDQYGVTSSAGNVRIITVDRVVTLRGPVDNANEQSAIGAIAQNVAGVSRVDNQLEIANQ